MSPMIVAAALVAMLALALTGCAEGTGRQPVSSGRSGAVRP